MKFIIFALILIQTAQANTQLLMVGGGTRPPEAMSAFVQAAGDAKANILVCSWASATTEGAEGIKAELLSSNPGAVNLFPSFPMKGDDENKLRTMLQSATGIFFSGGDQTSLMNAIKSENLKEAFKTAYLNGVVFGGTSAGTAVMSERMISGDPSTPRDAPPLSEGLGLLPSEIIVDQHFILRQRFNRLAILVMNNPNTYGVGIDEGTALLVTNGRIGRVIGPSQVLTFSPKSDHQIFVEYFKNNDLFNLFGLKN